MASGNSAQNTVLKLSRALEDGTHLAFHYGRQVKRGELLKLRRGIYVPTITWFEAHPSERFSYAIQAVAAHLEASFSARECLPNPHRAVDAADGYRGLNLE